MTPETKELLLDLAKHTAEDLYVEYGAQGTWVAKDELPSDPSAFEDDEYEEIFGSERLEEIKNGQPPTEAEIRGLREARLEKMLSDDGDADSIPAFCLAEVDDCEGNTGIALILCTGHSFSGVSIWVEDVFDTTADAFAYLDENGWMSVI
jgi:hypothetical protein